MNVVGLTLLSNKLFMYVYIVCSLIVSYDK